MSESPQAMRVALTVLHLWRHPKYQADCKVCRFIEPGRGKRKP